MLQPFRDLFQGGELGYGQWYAERGAGLQAVTRKGPAPIAAYEQHLSGEAGLGLVPVRLDGTCLFGAIDIDVDDIDHVALAASVSRLGLPLNVCRSKSGGAHLYAFFKQPIAAAELQPRLKRWAAALGHGRAEVFPKQLRIDGDNIGNWINLPYFGSDDTTRYCVTDRALTLAEFLAQVKYCVGKPVINGHALPPPPPPITVTARVTLPRQASEPVEWSFEDGPPCLQRLASGGVKEGGRNSVFFNVGVYIRKKHGNELRELLPRANRELGQPPLEENELKIILRSLNKATYQYTCLQEPFASSCDRTQCMLQRYGVGHSLGVEEDGLAVFEPSNLRKVATRPPTYRLDVNGRTIFDLTTEQLRNFKAITKAVFEQLDVMIKPIKENDWHGVLNTLMATLTVIPAPDDASVDGLVVDQFIEFASRRERTDRLEEVLRGQAIELKGEVLFRATDLRTFMQMTKQNVPISQIYNVLQVKGCTVRQTVVAGKVVDLWVFPVERLNEQKEDFEPARFEPNQEL